MRPAFWASDFPLQKLQAPGYVRATLWHRVFGQSPWLELYLQSFIRVSYNVCWVWVPTQRSTHPWRGAASRQNWNKNLLWFGAERFGAAHISEGTDDKQDHLAQEELCLTWLLQLALPLSWPNKTSSKGMQVQCMCFCTLIIMFFYALQFAHIHILHVVNMTCCTTCDSICVYDFRYQALKACGET